jgi:hypothetical protein
MPIILSPHFFNRINTLILLNFDFKSQTIPDKFETFYIADNGEIAVNLLKPVPQVRVRSVKITKIIS